MEDAVGMGSRQPSHAGDADGAPDGCVGGEDMEKTDSKAKVAAAGLLLAISISALAYTLCKTDFKGAAAQRRSVRAAFLHGDHLAAQIKNDARFSRVILHGQSGEPEGCIIVYGRVETESDLTALREVLQQDPLPVAVEGNITLGESEASRLIKWRTEPQQTN